MMELLIALVEGAVVQYEQHVEDCWNEAADEATTDPWRELDANGWRDEFRLCQRALRQLRPNLFE